MKKNRYQIVSAEAFYLMVLQHRRANVLWPTGLLWVIGVNSYKFVHLVICLTFHPYVGPPPSLRPLFDLMQPEIWL